MEYFLLNKRGLFVLDFATVLAFGGHRLKGNKHMSIKLKMSKVISDQC